MTVKDGKLIPNIQDENKKKVRRVRKSFYITTETEKYLIG